MRNFRQSSIMAIASMCHAANAAYCRSIGDHTQPAWGDAPEWQRNSAIAGVEFHLANPEAGPAASHENWMAGKLADGWKHGETKDPGKKKHPCLVPFNELSPQQQFKDVLFQAIVHGMAGALETLEDDIDVLGAEVEHLNRSIAGHKGLATRERRKAEALEAQLPPKPRTLGPIAEQLAPAHLLELIDDAERVEIAFSDGAREIKGCAPRSIDGDAWQCGPDGRLTLQVPSLLVHGPAPGDRPYVVRGYALLVDGEHVAFAPCEDRVIAAGANFELKGDVIFG